MRLEFAGSAIAQNAGRIRDIDTWDPTDKKRKLLLISRASEPPNYIQLSEMGERETTGERRDLFLKGQSVNFVNMEWARGHQLHNRIQNLKMKKADVKSKIQDFFKFCKDKNYKPMLYYTGHGELSTGNWCLADGTIGIKEILVWIPTGMEPPTICTDSCFGGVLADYCIQKNISGFHCLSATAVNQAAYDHTGKLLSTVET